ncbi:uncharacterized protein LOC107473346 [Arachis duranensis]|uniref:Uncharacterized protein LOC107473346 n=1 Tax=Arachis duranensis TaxID=130453 RepID=A0A6P4CBB8_ARADU|nr:uncharacterized protein LOC107473346 [Arachis duranensis]
MNRYLHGNERMIALKAIHPSFSPTNSKYDIHCTGLLQNKRSPIFGRCKSNESDSQPGDTRQQELLAQIAMIEAQKIRLMDYVDERSAYLTQFGKEAIVEFEKIGEEALKGLDEADARITANIERKMLEFEESTELNRQEISNRENELKEFEVQMEDDRNEGLFFKNLRKKAPVDIAQAKVEAQKIKDLTREKAGGKARRYVYLFFIGLLGIGIVKAIAVSSSTDWRKVAVLFAILVALTSQFIYEQNMSLETGRTRKTNNEENN